MELKELGRSPGHEQSSQNFEENQNSSKCLGQKILQRRASARSRARTGAVNARVSVGTDGCCHSRGRCVFGTVGRCRSTKIRTSLHHRRRVRRGPETVDVEKALRRSTVQSTQRGLRRPIDSSLDDRRGSRCGRIRAGRRLR